MKKWFLLACLLLFPFALSGQEIAVQAPKYGYLQVDSLLFSLPEYQAQTKQLEELRKKYAAETEYNEADFKRQFAEYLSGQSTFPPTILMKRQKDLQEAMEKSIAFRNESDALLRRAEADLRRPLRLKLQEAIRRVGKALHLDFVFDLGSHAYPYFDATLSVDITEKVKSEMQ